MIGLIRTRGFHLYRQLGDLERLSKEATKEGERDCYVGVMKDGFRFNMVEHERDALLRRPVQLMPANPGVTVITRQGLLDDMWLRREPLIAWALCLDGEIRAVTPNGVPDDTDWHVYVEMPDGKIEGVGEHADPFAFDSFADMETYYVSLKAGGDDA